MQVRLCALGTHACLLLRLACQTLAATQRSLTERGPMANVKGLKDMKEENDDEERQHFYAGGQGRNGGGSG